jgi:hypothetical protein
MRLSNRRGDSTAWSRSASPYNSATTNPKTRLESFGIVEKQSMKHNMKQSMTKQLNIVTNIGLATKKLLTMFELLQVPSGGPSE